jgi:ankyrin repeat domain-containing protein 50
LRIAFHPKLTARVFFRSIAINHLEQRFEQGHVVIAYVYCSYKEREDQTAVNLTASLLQQLVQRGPVISNDIVSLYRHHSKMQTRPTLDELSKLLQLEVRRFSKAFIVIDALDECPESKGTRDSFVAEIRKLQPIAHVMVTSRHISTIEREFEKAARVEIRASGEDVRRYLEGRIENEGRLIRLVKADLALQETILNTIVENAKGM